MLCANSLRRTATSCVGTCVRQSSVLAIAPTASLHSDDPFSPNYRRPTRPVNPPNSTQGEPKPAQQGQRQNQQGEQNQHGGQRNQQQGGQRKPFNSSTSSNTNSNTGNTSSNAAGNTSGNARGNNRYGGSSSNFGRTGNSSGNNSNYNSGNNYNNNNNRYGGSSSDSARGGANNYQHNATNKQFQPHKTRPISSSKTPTNPTATVDTTQAIFSPFFRDNNYHTRDTTDRMARVMDKKKAEQVLANVGFSRSTKKGKVIPLTDTSQNLVQKEHVQRIKEVSLYKGITLIDLSQATGVKVDKLKGMLGDITGHSIETEDSPVSLAAAELVVQDLGFAPKMTTKRKFTDVKRHIPTEEERASFTTRPAIVTIMGHVDHGKTSLLDFIRGSSVASTEAGGITQRITATTVELKSTNSTCTFIDTPGHAAFTRMRSRGARVTDVAVLVVSAVDGLMPQTIEAIRHIQSVKVPFVVAVNKCDLPAAEPHRIRSQLLQYNIIVEDLGGEVPAIDVSAKTGAGVDALLDAVSVLAMEANPIADPQTEADGCVLEARVDQKAGITMTAIVLNGSLKVGDAFVAGAAHGHVRSLEIDHNPHTSIGPGIPVTVSGLRAMPSAGDDFIVVESETRAREVARMRQELKIEKRIRHQMALAKAVAEKGCVEQCVVVKGDSMGTVEAIIDCIQSVPLDEVAMRVVRFGVGPVTEADLAVLAETKGAIVYAFNIRTPANIGSLALNANVEIRHFDVIYGLLDDVHATLSALLKPDAVVNVTGKAIVNEVFNVKGRRQRHEQFNVAGCRVVEGSLKRSDLYRITRNGEQIFEGKLHSMRQFKESANQIVSGQDCGLIFEGFTELQAEDVITAVHITYTPRKLPQDVFDVDPSYNDPDQDGSDVETDAEQNS